MKILEGNFYMGPRFSNETTMNYLGGKGKLEFKSDTTLGLDSMAEGKMKFMAGGAIVNGAGHADVVAGFCSVNKLKNNIDLGNGVSNKTVSMVEAIAGGNARANGKVYVGGNGIELGYGAKARVGAWIEGKVTNSLKVDGKELFVAKGSAGAGLGVGIGAEGKFAFRIDRVGFDGEVTLGPFTLGGGTYVNPKAVAELAFDRGGKAVRYVKAKSRKLVDNAKRKFADAKRKASDMVDGAKKKLANAKEKVGDFVSSGWKRLTD